MMKSRDEEKVWPCLLSFVTLSTLLLSVCLSVCLHGLKSPCYASLATT